jgi:DNA invertase Pin-like site-specific DNA recombinase
MYYGYIRVSTESQARHGGGLDVQRSEIERYAKDHGIKIEEIFCDGGVSGTKESREGIDDLFAVLDKGDYIIIQNTNRLWRDIFAEAAILKTMQNIGADIISIDEPNISLNSILKDPEGALMFGVMSAIATYQRLEINRKLARGRTTKANKGDKPAGVAAYGYAYSADKKHIEINPDEAPTVRRIFSEAQKGQSLEKIAAMLNSQGSRTRRGSSWQKGNLAIILHNDFYIGVVRHQGKEIPGNHEPLISKIQFGKVQAQLKRRHR